MKTFYYLSSWLPTLIVFSLLMFSLPDNSSFELQEPSNSLETCEFLVSVPTQIRSICLSICLNVGTKEWEKTIFRSLWSENASESRLASWLYLYIHVQFRKRSVNKCATMHTSLPSMQLTSGLQQPFFPVEHFTKRLGMPKLSAWGTECVTKKMIGLFGLSCRKNKLRLLFCCYCSGFTHLLHRSAFFLHWFAELINGQKNMTLSMGNRTRR